VTRAPDALKRRRTVARGIAWNTAYQVFEVGASFGAMLILVRLIPPADYGRASVVVALLTLLNAWSSSVFVRHALQLPEGQQPDWSLHWSAGLYVQLGLMALCHALAALCWLAPQYRPIAPLMHIASLGFVLDWPAELRAKMLRREMDFPRLKVLLAFSTLLRLAVTMGVAWAGGGAYAIVLGGNVVPAVPFAVDLLLVHRWCPRAGWWRWPDWAAYRPSLHFGLQQAASALLSSARGALEVAVLPGAVGYAGMGLLNRATALFTGGVGRMGQVLNETVYPLLPRYAADPGVYARLATLFVQVLFLTVIPSTLYMGLEGRLLSRLLYGERWIAADPLMWPAALSTLGLATFGIGSTVLLAGSRLRLCFLLEVAVAALSLPILGVAWIGRGLVAYAWAHGAAQIVLGSLALVAAAPLLAPGWVRSGLFPSALTSLCAMGAVLAVDSLGVSWPLAPRLCLDTALYGLTYGLMLRACFPGVLRVVLSRVPGGGRVGGWLRLPGAGSVPPTR